MTDPTDGTTQRAPEYRSPLRTVGRVRVRARGAAPSRTDLSPFYVLAILSGALTGYVATLFV